IIKEFELGKIENIKLFHDGKLSEFRYIAVLKAEDTCLRCHARQGFKKGDIIGGTAITFPAEPVIILQKNKKLNLIFLHISIYLLVSLLSLYIFFRTRKQWMILKNIQNDQELRIQMRTFELEEAYIKLTKELKAHKETSDLLMKSEARLIAINDSALEAIITIDKESTIISWNHAAEEMFGYSQEEIIGKSLMIIMPETFREKHLKSINKYFHFPFGQGGIIPTIGKTVEFSGLKKDGSEFPIEISLASWKADDQIFFTGIIRNISKRKQLDKQLKELNHTLEERVIEEIEKGRKKEQILIQQSKMASMGEMISAIAHQWRQPLNALGLIIQDIKEAFHANELDQQYIEKSIKDSMDQIKMMSNTIDDFRDFFRKSKQRAPFNIIKSIKFTQSIFSAQLKNNAITINNIYNEDEDIIVNGFFNEFNQVILNIMSNAKDAIVEARVKGILGPEGGQIIIRALKEDDRAVLKIGNNGGPIPENLLDTIFEPYFTTKEEGKGTGIGLYMAKSIIEQSMNGKIFVENMGYGVIFTIYLDIYRE
ncbi:MAG: PAS domain S-box protein, partial [Nitrospirae bacterium]|nr:PAS domain S-box protein [Nitrospirota bacterium]